ncbi:MAG: hypothetical protein AMS18_13580 [Gemmatimonas sp. SG8_17]|nr:MAG: hypothetical protein AMS18_13580 [Gemmatimonas sp. SG8_17]
MHFHTAGVDVAPWIPPLVAFVVSFFTSMGGVSGAFLLLPFQMSFLGYTAPSVSATNQLFNIGAIPSGVIRYIREGRMVWPLTWVIVIGTVPGVVIGALVRVVYLPDPTDFRLFAGLVLLYLGTRMVRDLFRRNGDKRGPIRAEQRFRELVKQRGVTLGQGSVVPAVVMQRCDAGSVCYEFSGERYEVSTVGLAALSLIVGVVGGIYGIGGGAIIAPLLVTFFKLPVYTVAGAALLGTFVTSVAGVGSYQAIAPLYPDFSVAPDWLLGLLFGLGGMVGMYFGARCQKYVPALAIKWMLSVIILFIAARYTLSILDR